MGNWWENRYENHLSRTQGFLCGCGDGNREPSVGDRGEAFAVEIDAPIGGMATVDLIVQRGTHLTLPTGRKHYDSSSAQRDKYQEAYAMANNQEMDQQQHAIEKGLHTFTLQLPADFSGPCHARIYIEGVDGFALGAADIYVNQKIPPIESAKKIVGDDRIEGGLPAQIFLTNEQR